jgi:hypothetical protein
MMQFEADRMRAEPMSILNRRVATRLLAALGLISAIGCGDGGLATYPVTGTVKVDGKPAGGAMVTFCPTTGSEELMKLRPIGHVGPDGKFEVTTFNKGDGLPEGDYKILIRWPTKVAGVDENDPRSVGPDRLRGRYMNLERTTFTVKVDSSTTELPPFELKSK